MNNAEFDKIVRQTMESGAEELPAGLWAGIEGKLGTPAAGPGLSVLGAFLRRWGAVIGTAAAACLAVVLYLVLQPSPVPDDTAVYVCQSSEISTPPSIMAITMAETESAASEPASSPTVSAVLSVSPTPATATATAAPATAATAETTTETATEVETVSTPEPSYPDFAADFADIEERETYRPKRRAVALTAALSSGGNTGNRASSMAGHSRSSFNCGADGKLTESQGTFYMVPIRAAVGVRFNIGHNLAIGTGLNYTFLTRRLKGNYDCGAVESFPCDNITNNQHYIGIPLNLYYNFVNREKFNVYANAGASVEKCVSNSYRFSIRYNQPDLQQSYPKTIREKVNGLQIGLNLGLGIQYNFSKLFSLYLDPYACWYIPNYQQPKSIRTVQPLQFGAEFGVRFNL